jgi:hypothetical protein
VHQRIAGGFRPVGDGGARDEQHAHGGEDRPALALVADHAAEDVGEGRADREDRDHLDHVRDGARVFEGMRRVGVEEAAAIGAEHLDGELRGDRAERDGLLRPFQGRRRHIGTEGLRHAERDVNEGQNDADRQQYVERGAGHIDPEVAERLAGRAREGADQSNGDRHAGRGGHEVLHAQPRHLGEVRHGAFAAIVLPVGVGDEAHSGIKRQFRPDRSHAGRVERQHALHALQSIKQQQAGKVEREHGEGIARPALLLAVAGARKRIKAPFDRNEDGRKECTFPGKDARHIGAERFDEGKDDPAEKQDL